MKIRNLLDSPEKWTKDALARNADGEVVTVHSPEACSWCLVGAMYKCYGYGMLTKADLYILISDYLIKTGKNDRGHIPAFNDGTSFEEIRTLVETLDI